MTIGILDLPQELLVGILNTVSIRTLCRLRRTCKVFDEIAEEHRFHIQNASKRIPRILWITIDKTPRYKIHVLHEKIDFSTLNCFQRALNQPRGVEIRNGFRELSGVKFDAVVLELHLVVFGSKAQVIRSCQQTLFKTFARSLMIQLRLSVDWLCFDNVPSELAIPVMEEVKFQSLGFADRNLEFKDMKKWKLGECREMNIGCINKLEEELLLGIRHLNVVRIRFTMADVELFEDFMHNIRGDPALHGYLKILKLISSEKFEKWKWEEVMDATPGLKLLSDTDIRFENTRKPGAYRKMLISDGYALIAHTNLGGCHIHFVEDDSRFTLFKAFSGFCSKDYRKDEVQNKLCEFMGAKTDEDALDLLCN